MMIDPETGLEISDTNGSHPDAVLRVCAAAWKDTLSPRGFPGLGDYRHKLVSSPARTNQNSPE